MDRINRAKQATVKGYETASRGSYASAVLAPLIIIVLFVTGCGGGGSSGGAPVSVTAPPHVSPPTRLSLSYGPSYEAEYDNQRGLAAIGAASAYDAGYAGFGVRLAVVDTGVDAIHAELTTIKAGHDFHSDSQGLIDPDGHGTHVASLIAARRNETNMPIEMLSIQEPAKRQTTSYLTGRERDVLNGLLAGQSNKEIARVHGLSEVTIKHHLKSLRSKLGARNRTHAVCRAVELGIAEDDYAMA